MKDDNASTINSVLIKKHTKVYQDLDRCFYNSRTSWAPEWQTLANGIEEN